MKTKRFKSYISDVSNLKSRNINIIEFSIYELFIEGGKSMVNWIKARLAERTSWDGLTIVIVSALVIVASPFVKLLAWPALVWGLYSLYKKEQ